MSEISDACDFNVSRVPGLREECRIMPWDDLARFPVALAYCLPRPHV